MEDYFIKLPNKLFYPREDKTIIQECDYDFKVVEILSYLYTNTNRKGITIFTLEDMIQESGYKLNKNKGKTNDQFKTILNTLKELGLIVSELDFLTIKPTQLIKCQLDLFETDGVGKEKRDIKFVQIFDSEKDKIYNSELAEKVDKLKLYTYYCYIKSRIFKKNSQVVCSGGKAEVCYPSFECIKADLGIQDVIIKKYNDILVDLGMIKIANAGLFYYATDKHKKARESCNIYALGNHEVTDMNLKYALRAYKEDGEEKRVFIDTKDYKNNNKKMNGYIARITQLEKEGKATQEQINKKNEYLESVNLTDRKAEIQNLLENNEGVLLSTIYYKNNRDKYEEKYIDIEEKVGLLNSNWELREEINWDYYCWIMTNYTEDKHDFYVNCVAKKIREYSKVDKVVEGVKKVKLDPCSEAKRLFG